MPPIPETSSAFQTGERKAIPAVLIYLRWQGRVLMIHKLANPGDGWHAGKWNGLGGKLERDESPLQAAQREILEEAGIALPEAAFKPLGVLQFPNFKPDRSEDWVVWVFTVKLEHHPDNLQMICDEGELHWVKDTELLGLPIWEGD